MSLPNCPYKIKHETSLYIYIYIYIYIYEKLAASSGPALCLYLSALSDSKIYRDKQFVLYMYSIKDGLRQHSVTLYIRIRWGLQITNSPSMNSTKIDGHLSSRGWPKLAQKWSNNREILKIINNVFYELIVHKKTLYDFFDIFMVAIIKPTYGSSM